MYATQDRTAPVLPDIQRPTHAPITVTVEVPHQGIGPDGGVAPAPRPIAPVKGWERVAAFATLSGVIALVMLPVGMHLGRQTATTEINQANGAKAAAEETLEANRAKIESFCKSVK